MTKKKSILVWTSLTIVFTLIAFGSVGAADYVFRACTNGNMESTHYTGMKRFKELAEKYSQGKIEVKLFHSAALGDQGANLESMQAGTLEMATCDTPITIVDEMQGVFGLPYMFRDHDHVKLVMEGPIGIWAADRISKKRLEVLGLWEGGFRHITNNKRPIIVPSDLKGVKMRVPSSSLRIQMFKQYGADASPLPYAELYSALQMGVFDGQENPLHAISDVKFYEVQKYLSLSNHVYTVSYFLMSQAVYRKLPLDLQLLLKQAGYEATTAVAALHKKQDESVVALAESKGMKVNKVNTAAFVEASKQIWDSFAKQMGEEAKKIIDLIEDVGK